MGRWYRPILFFRFPKSKMDLVGIMPRHIQFSKKIFFLSRKPPPLYLRACEQSIVRFFLRTCNRSIVHPRQNSRPRTIVAAGILTKTDASAFLSATDAHCPCTADSRMCLCAVNISHGRTLANWSMCLFHWLVGVIHTALLSVKKNRKNSWQMIKSML